MRDLRSTHTLDPQTARITDIHTHIIPNPISSPRTVYHSRTPIIPSSPLHPILRTPPPDERAPNSNRQGVAHFPSHSSESSCVAVSWSPSRTTGSAVTRRVRQTGRL
ncbi:hypothetical protein P170DRAFT_134604 [Aspergillus steynii IBT 23096]|uniref:Uncharacterized protein n=1 Tax=Aspergillus steynii IBT 23096 TaxID=1392250 RepID=A0A2I2GAW7_9EURO|nr:uncharacterized protein P170DRAFT_134604 [Aspergillus steynii IBT 23096]PLB49997.1 hypothetical protein P170DRAFT_134604 [Aspergillus steynii IBT 23096]